MIQAGHLSDRAYVFFALSSDALPVQWAGLTIPIGSDLYFTDTNELLKWSGTTWFKVVRVVEEDPVYNPLLTGMNEVFLQMLSELRCMRLAMVKLACDGGGNPLDFDPVTVSTDPEIADQQLV